MEKSNEFVWSYLAHFGVNSWKDIPLETQPADKPEKWLTRCAADYVRFDEDSWRRLTARLKAAGCNQIVIDLAEIVRYPSHPELAVKGSWSVERLQTELARLRGMGFEVIPKMNFSACHDTWLKDYHRMVSTPAYYRVCEDLIRDAVEIFDHPRYFHLGYDEETAPHQAHHLFTVCRQGELWWHDFLWFVRVTEKTGSRPWIWSDYIWHHKDEFLRRMPKSVLQSNWYYGASFETKDAAGNERTYVAAYEWLDKAGFDQIPTGSNFSCDTNFGDTVKFCDAHCDKSHLKGYMMAPWTRTFAIHEQKSMQAIAQMAAAISGRILACAAPYDFQKRLLCVHEPDRREAALVPSADEFVFTDGVKVGDDDFADYLNVSMSVKASAEGGGAVSATLDGSLRAREYVIDVRKDGVAIRAADERALHQAYYHLEDRMNLRRAPFLKVGTERRRMRFSPRMIHSGYACDVFPDPYLKLIAHHGFDAIVFYIKDVNKTAAGPNQDVNDLIARARKAGLDTYLYSSVSCFAHPDDPKGRSEIEASFGRIAKAHPGAKGMVFVGESCQFPSKDPRVQPVRYRDINHADPRPLAGWFPCRDYPDWLRAVMDVVHRHSPNMEIVFWTYNWSKQDAKTCAELIPHFPDGVAIQGTLGNGAVTRHDNGLVCTCRDYTVSTPGFTDHYAAQARAAKAGNRRFYTMANTAGLTWDYGVAPYLPCPYQWKKRWDGLVDPQYGIAGLMETHHFGWYPSFISELAKEAFTEGGLPFDEHIRQIAARDFGEANVARVLDAWQKWSQTELDYVANNENQYGPFRIGPAFPYNFGGEKILHKDFPQDKKAYHTMRWMAILNFPFDLEQAHEQNIEFTELSDDYRYKQLELFERMRADFADGVQTLQAVAATLEGTRKAKAEEMIGVGAWHQRTVETAINLNRGYLAFKRGDQAEVLKYARAEYANAREALKLVERDSRLGWEPSMTYAAGPEQIRWKLRLMEKTYKNMIY